MATVAVVIEGAAASGAVELMCADLAGRGLAIRADWRSARPGVVCTGVVDDEPSAEQAVLAALRGAQLVVAATADREVIDRMCDDLRRLGPLDHRIEESAAVPVLTSEERLLVERLLAGDSLGDAAAVLHLSRRTADRRLASARRALRVTTTAELLAAAARLNG
jgi:DNA-binding NarL/FixJ family response regulator